MLKVSNLCKSFGDIAALNGLSFFVGKGQIYGFVGPNGAGKTTTFRIIAGLLEPSSGSILIDGNDLKANISDKIGYMPDESGVYENLKVWEYLDFFCGAYNISYKERKQRINELLELVSLSDKKEFKLEYLSRGSKQKLLIARSLVNNPEIILMDEPTAGLDPKARSELKAILKQLKKLGKTIIISSHVLSELSELCTHIGIIDKGTMLVSGTLTEILRSMNKKRSIFAKTLLPVRENNAITRVLEKIDDVVDLVEHDNGIEFGYNGDNSGLADVLRSLVQSGINIMTFSERENNLEDLFIEVIRGDDNNDESDNEEGHALGADDI